MVSIAWDGIRSRLPFGQAKSAGMILLQEAGVAATGRRPRLHLLPHWNAALASVVVPLPFQRGGEDADGMLDIESCNLVDMHRIENRFRHDLGLAHVASPGRTFAFRTQVASGGRSPSPANQLPKSVPHTRHMVWASSSVNTRPGVLQSARGAGFSGSR